MAGVSISYDEWKKHKAEGKPDPELLRVHFMDVVGNAHEQPLQ